MQSFPRQKFTPPHNGGIIEKVALVLVALKEMSPFAMINVCARAVALFHSQPNKQPTQKHTRMHIRQGKTPVSYLPLFYDFIIKFRHIFWLAEISLFLNLTPAAAPARIINPGKARARLSLYVQFQVRNNFLWHREEQECVCMCARSQICAFVFRCRCAGAGILNYLHAPLTLARAYTQHTPGEFAFCWRRKRARP